MIYLIDPKQVYGNKRCKAVVHPLYGIPCPGICSTVCLLVPI
jgi:hypothetical protein